MLPVVLIEMNLQNYFKICDIVPTLGLLLQRNCYEVQNRCKGHANGI